MRFLMMTALILGLALPVVAQTKDVSVKRGETVRIFTWMNFDDNCRITSIPKIRSKSRPKLGTLMSGAQTITIEQVEDRRLVRCIGTSGKGAVVTYTAGGMAGVDRFTLVRKRLDGKDAQIRFAVTIR